MPEMNIYCYFYCSIVCSWKLTWQSLLCGSADIFDKSVFKHRLKNTKMIVVLKGERRVQNKLISCVWISKFVSIFKIFDKICGGRYEDRSLINDDSDECSKQHQEWIAVLLIILVHCVDAVRGIISSLLMIHGDPEDRDQEEITRDPCLVCKVLYTVYLQNRGVYFVPKLYNCPKARQAHDENFYNCPQFACCVQWNILKFAHFVPFVGSF